MSRPKPMSQKWKSKSTSSFVHPGLSKRKAMSSNIKSEKVKATLTVAKDAIIAQKQDDSIAKLDEGIDEHQKRIFMTDRAEYTWRTVGEYLDNELADNDKDAKMKKPWNYTDWSMLLCHFGSTCFGYLFLNILLGSLHLLLHLAVSWQANLFHLQCIPIWLIHSPLNFY